MRVQAAARTAGGWRLETTDGEVEADVVVDAAGPWAARIGDLLGVHVPVIPLRNQIGIWRLARPLDRVMPMVMDYIPHSGTRGLYVATYDDADHVLAGLHSEEIDGEGVDPDAYDQAADDDYLADTRAALERRMPDLPLGEVERAWAGLYPVSPDGLPIIGPAAGDGSVDPRRGRRRLGHPALADHGRARRRLDRPWRAAITLRRSPCRARPRSHRRNLAAGAGR